MKQMFYKTILNHIETFLMFYPFSFLSSPFLSFLSFSPFFLFNMAWPTNESHFLAWEALPYATLAKLFLDITVHFTTGTDYLFNKENIPSHHFGLFSDGSCQIYFCGQKINTVFTPDENMGHKTRKKCLYKVLVRSHLD